MSDDACMTFEADGSIYSTKTAMILKPTRWGPYEFKSGGVWDEPVVVLRGAETVLTPESVAELSMIAEFFRIHDLKVVIE